MSQTYTELPYERRWKQLYPNIQFPTPEKYPHMYTKAELQYEPYVEDVDPLNPYCTNSSYCPKGPIDYQCQLKYDCYASLINLGLHILGFIIILFLVIGATTKLIMFLMKILKSLGFLAKMMGCFGTFLQKMSLGILGDQIIYIDQQTNKKITSKTQQVEKKLKNLNLQINIEQLDQFKATRILELVEDYSIQSETN